MNSLNASASPRTPVRHGHSASRPQPPRRRTAWSQSSIRRHRRILEPRRQRVAIRRLRPFRCLHDCSGSFRLKRFAGWASHPLETAAFSRRTPEAVIKSAAAWSSICHVGSCAGFGPIYRLTSHSRPSSATAPHLPDADQRGAPPWSVVGSPGFRARSVCTCQGL
jgi:hypothetical protein